MVKAEKTNTITKISKLIIPVTIIILLVGCEGFYTTGDEIVQDANAVAVGARAVLESPAGQLIPPDIKLYGLLGIGLINAIVIGWEEWRNSTMKRTTRAIVKGIEKTSNPDKTAAEIKSNIAEEMLKQGGDRFYARANKIVDRLKIS